MAYNDMYNTINANLRKYGTPQRGYGNELRRRQWYENYLQMGEGLQNVQFQYGRNTKNVRDSVTNAGYDSGNVRGSYSGDAFNDRMIDVRNAYQQGLNGVAAALRGQQNAEWAWYNRPRPKKPPAAPTMPVYAPPANLPDDAARAEYNTWYDQQMYRWKQQMTAWEKNYGVGAR